MSGIDAYARTLIRPGPVQLFLYAAHEKDANYVQVGVGMETANGLQRAHIAGPQFHEFHIPAVLDWLETGSIELVHEPWWKTHPFSSGNFNLIEFLKGSPFMHLSIGRFAPLYPKSVIPTGIVRSFGAALEKVQKKAFGHPLDWDVRFVELLDGRFIWFAYDDEIERIRIGLGFYNDANDRQFGVHDYAVGRLEAPAFCVQCFGAPSVPIQFMGLPPRWPSGLETLVYGEAKQKLAVELLRLADLLWSGLPATQ